MSCGRCGADMLKTELYLSGTPETIKTINGWRCDHCGRIEYYSGRSSPQATPFPAFDRDRKVRERM